MHEFGIAEDLLEAARSEADRLGEGPLRGIGVRLGSGAGIEAEALRTSFELLIADLGIGPVTLEIEDVPQQHRCECGVVFEDEDPIAACPECGGPAVPVPGPGLQLDYLKLGD
jgi:hydrogenase nickel incorporation protein HypA/HybF